MRDAARTKNRFAATKRQVLITNCKGHLSRDQVEVLLLVQVLVQRRSAIHQIHVLDDKQSAARLSRKHLEKDRAVAARMGFAEKISARAR